MFLGVGRIAYWFGDGVDDRSFPAKSVYLNWVVWMVASMQYEVRSSIAFHLPMRNAVITSPIQY